LATAASLLVLASIASELAVYWSGRAWWARTLFHVDVERNVPTAFSAFLLLFAALLLTVIAVLARNQPGSSPWHWTILSFGFLFMAVDEAWSFHEMLVGPTRRLLGDFVLGLAYFGWVIPVSAVVIVLATFFWPFLLRLPARTKLAFFLAAGLYLGGAIVVEVIGGRFAVLHGKRSLMFSVMRHIEESLEMAGVIVFIWALLKYLADTHREVRLRFDGARGRNHGRPA
jgi:hypothetical protein